MYVTVFGEERYRYTIQKIESGKVECTSGGRYATRVREGSVRGAGQKRCAMRLYKIVGRRLQNNIGYTCTILQKLWRESGFVPKKNRGQSKNKT